MLEDLIQLAPILAQKLLSVSATRSSRYEHGAAPDFLNGMGGMSVMGESTWQKERQRNTPTGFLPGVRRVWPSTSGAQDNRVLPIRNATTLSKSPVIPSIELGKR